MPETFPAFHGVSWRFPVQTGNATGNGTVADRKTKKAAVTKALQEFIARRRQREILELFRKFDWNPDFDYKKERQRR